MGELLQQCASDLLSLIDSANLAALQYVAWTGTAIGALVAAVSLRRSAKQSRATFFLSLNPLWTDLKDARNAVIDLTDTVIEQLTKSKTGQQVDKKRLGALRGEYKKQLGQIELMPDGAQQLLNFYSYLNFFEIVGLMVRKRYVQLRDIYLLYKGPIIEIDDAFSQMIPEWQGRFNAPDGLYGNLLYLIKRVRRYEKIDDLHRSMKFWRR
ncbi:MAG: hypothetical protein MN733_42090 [Nitrososphaera sp.]|nr:hypothetical protein [Nitrososphaera sp.]